MSAPSPGLWWAGVESAATRYPEPTWSRCRSAWTAASEYAQTSFDPVPIPVWPSEGSLSETRHLGDPAPNRAQQMRSCLTSDLTEFWCSDIDKTKGDKVPD